MYAVDWAIVSAFVVALVVIAVVTNRMTKSVAGFLSSERCAGRYLLTIAQSMAFCSAIGMAAGFEASYRNGIGGLWWGMLMMPIGIAIALSGWVTYRYRQTRALTMAQFLEQRYSRKFRVCAGIAAFISGMLNCAVFPMVTGRFIMYLTGLPEHYELLGITLPTFNTLMFIMVGTGVALAIAGGQVTIMVTDFLQGVIASIAVLAVLCFVLKRFGFTPLIDTLAVSEFIHAAEPGSTAYPVWFTELAEPIKQTYLALMNLNADVFSVLRDHSEIVDTLKNSPAALSDLAIVSELRWSPELLAVLRDNATSVVLLVSEKYPDMVAMLQRPEGVSMMNPFRQAGLPDFGPLFFFMSGALMVAKTGIWQGGAGYMTAARTPHEGKMGNILSSWRWLMIQMGTVFLVIAGYNLIWNEAFGAEQEVIRAAVDQIREQNIQSQVFMPIVVRNMLPAGLMGLFAIYVIGAAVSTDDSAYHSWGSIFLQDVVMPFRKKPFTTEQHLRYLRWSIVGVGAFALLFSSIWTMKEFIYMWFEITGAIYVGGASCAIIGGLYWKRATTQGAWSGLITGSVLSVSGIVARQIWPGMTFPGTDTVINGMHIALFAVVVSYALFIIVSLATCRKAYNMDQLLHRGKYAVERDRDVRNERQSWIARKVGITTEFSLTDKIIYFTMIGWTGGWAITFVVGTAYNLAHDVSTETWKTWWTVILGVQVTVAAVTAIWYVLGGLRDVVRLFRDLARVEVNELDDGMVHGYHAAADEKLGLPVDDDAEK